MRKISFVLLSSTLWMLPASADTLWEQAQRQQSAYNYDASVRAYAQSQIDNNHRTYNAPASSSSSGGAGSNWTNYFPEEKPKTLDRSTLDKMAVAEAARKRWDGLTQKVKTAPGKPLPDPEKLWELQAWYENQGFSWDEAFRMANGDRDDLERRARWYKNTLTPAEAELMGITPQKAPETFNQDELRFAEALKSGEHWALYRAMQAEYDKRKKAEWGLRFMETKATDSVDPKERKEVLKVLEDVYRSVGVLADDFLYKKWQAVQRKDRDAQVDAENLTKPRPAGAKTWPEISALAAALQAQVMNPELSPYDREKLIRERDNLFNDVARDFGHFHSAERTQARFEYGLYELQDRLNRHRFKQPPGQIVDFAPDKEAELRDAWKAGELLKYAAAEGEPRAMSMVGEAMCVGYIGTGKGLDFRRGFEYITRAKDLKEPRALGLWAGFTMGSVQNEPDAATNPRAQKAFQAATEGALRHDVLSLRYVALAHYRGYGTPKDLPKAIEAGEVAARAGDLDAEEFLVDHYIQAAMAGDKSKNQRLVELVDKMVARQDINSYGWKAILYYRGIASAQDIPAAVELWKKSAKIGNWCAARNLAKVTGLGVQGNTPKTSFQSIGLEAALKTFEEHCDRNGAEQQFQLGMFYMNQPKGMPFLPEPNPLKAKIWFQKAADGGDERAKSLLDNYDETVGAWIKALQTQKNAS